MASIVMICWVDATPLIPSAARPYMLARAVWLLDVLWLGPFLVESYLAGSSLFEREIAKITLNIIVLYEGTRSMNLPRYGEGDDKTE